MNAPTKEQFEAYQKIFDFMNARLFDGSLPSVLLNFSRKSGSKGFFAAERWSRGKEIAHEISLNPQILKIEPDEETVSTLVHEMVHLWRYGQPDPPSNGYHDKAWAQKMIKIGLQPDDGNGETTGFRMSHRIIPDGAFQEAFQEMPEELRLPWKCEETPFLRRKSKGLDPKKKIRYACTACKQVAWGKPGLWLICGLCQEDMEEGATPVRG